MDAPNIQVDDSRGLAGRAILERVIEDLSALNRNSEQSFLELGAKLVEFIAAVDLISSEVTTLTDLVSGEHMGRASEALTSALNRSVEMRGHSKEGSGVLSGIREEANRMAHTFAAFQGTVSTFRVLGVLTRIEAARLGSAGNDFGTLADEVKLLAADIQARVENSLKASASLIPPIERALQTDRDLPAMAARVLASFAAFREIQKTAHDSAVRLIAEYDETANAFKRLMVSVQFHDITRQQVEHVIEILQRLCGEFGRSDTTTIVAIQSSQLGDAASKFAISIASIVRDLDDISNHAARVADETRTLSGLTGDQKDSFFLQMEQGCSAILAGLGLCSKAEADTETTSGGLAETIEQMRGPIQEIRAIERRMKRMGMNARIQAAHTGAAGQALGVLAGTMQQLAFESEQRSESLAQTINSMSEAATRLATQRQLATAEDRENPDLALEKMQTAVAELHSSSERSFAIVAQVTARSVNLQAELAITRHSFSVGADFAAAISRARAMLEQVEGKYHSGAPGALAEAHEELEDFVTHYTMQSERDVHLDVTRTVLGVGYQTAPAKALPVPPAKATEFGDNVELF
jgi:hypothetical protein